MPLRRLFSSKSSSFWWWQWKSEASLVRGMLRASQQPLEAGAQLVLEMVLEMAVHNLAEEAGHQPLALRESLRPGQGLAAAAVAAAVGSRRR
mmetsp:Transcript_33701/g.78770  ORF Transcript_33701/g.78770 Transcript_33701/m.78770 type:complete len:92 (-) Transcript_33701:836-1111(-)